MKTAALVRTFYKDHFRTNAVLLEAIMAVLFAALFLDPRDAPYSWTYLVMSFSILAMIMAALVTILLARRNSDQRTDHLILKAGRVRCYCGMLLASLAITLSWLLIIAFYIYVLLLQFSLPVGVFVLAAAVIGMLLVVAALFLLFSSFAGKSYEPPLAAILVILGLSSSYFMSLGDPWSKTVILLPPLLENVQALSGAAANFPLTRTLVYIAVLLIIGLFRFNRREFLRS